MSLPLSWVAAGAIPTAQALKQTANLAATSANHFFGEFLQSRPQQPSPPSVDNGLSATIAPIRNQKASNDVNSLKDRMESLRSYLTKFLNDSRARFGLQPGVGTKATISISSNGVDTPQLKGPEPSRTELENHLREHPAIVKEINEVALLKSNSSPLRLLPSTDKHDSATEPWTLWLD